MAYPALEKEILPNPLTALATFMVVVEPRFWYLGMVKLQAN